MKPDCDKDQPEGGNRAAAREGGDLPVRRTTARDTTTRSFVLQISPDCEEPSRPFAGRVQHLATSDGGNFDSLEALEAIVRRVLSRTTE